MVQSTHPESFWPEVKIGPLCLSGMWVNFSYKGNSYQGHLLAMAWVSFIFTKTHVNISVKNKERERLNKTKKLDQLVYPCFAYDNSFFLVFYFVIAMGPGTFIPTSSRYHKSKTPIWFKKFKTPTWQAFTRRSHILTEWSREPDMKLSSTGDVQRDTTLQRKWENKLKGYIWHFTNQ